MIVRLSLIALLVVSLAPVSFAQDAYPAPVSEYVEQTGPTTMTFLSYPKYYRDAEGQLAEIDTTLRPSTDPEWDYQVTAGIWTLRVRKDGTYQAEHAGDVFTYRFADLGIGRGEGFQSLNLGEPDFSRFSVMGDRIRWSDVLPGVDLEVRYIHDILKVDVIVKQSRREAIQSRHAQGWLTAKFDIPSVLVRSQAKQAGVSRDLYAEALDIDQPLVFEQDGKTVHKMRPVENYILDAEGKPLRLGVDSGRESFPGRQTWRLREGAPGEAELSADLSVLRNVPQGDLVVDPSMFFNLSSGSMDDSFINYNDQNANYGNNVLLQMKRQVGSYRSILFSFPTVASALGSGKDISFARLELYVDSISNPQSGLGVRAHKMKQSWQESSVKWTHSGDASWSPSYWNGSDVYYDTIRTHSSELLVSPGVLAIDLTVPFKSLYNDDISDIGEIGFHLVPTYLNDAEFFIASSENLSSFKRPKLTIGYDSPIFGADVGSEENASTVLEEIRMGNAYNDKQRYIRFFPSTFKPGEWKPGYPLQNGLQFQNFIENAEKEGLQVILVMIPDPRPEVDGNDSSKYAARVDLFLELAELQDPNLLGNTIVGIQFGNEEDASTKLWRSLASGTEPTLSYNAGQKYGEFLLAGINVVKATYANKNLELISGSVEDHRILDWNDPIDETSTKKFIQGFVDYVYTNGGVSKLPDVISIHGYNPGGAPESHNYVDGDYIHKEWIHRLDTLDSIINKPGYSPKIAVTEYGYSPTNGRHFAPYEVDMADDASMTTGNQMTQAVSYMRRVLLDATMRSTSNLHWMYSLYWQYPYNFDSSQYNSDTGWWDTNATTNPRAIRIVSNKLFDHSDGSPGLHGCSLWFKASSVDMADNTRVMKCGWLDESQTKWAAVWRYKNGFEPNSTQGRTFYGWTPTGYSYTLEVPGTITGSADLYRFNFAVLSNPTWPSSPLASISPTHSGGKTYYNLTGYVDENPVFVHIDQ